MLTLLEIKAVFRIFDNFKRERIEIIILKETMCMSNKNQSTRSVVLLKELLENLRQSFSFTAMFVDNEGVVDAGNTRVYACESFCDNENCCQCIWFNNDTFDNVFSVTAGKTPIGTIIIEKPFLTENERVFFQNKALKKGLSYDEFNEKMKRFPQLSVSQYEHHKTMIKSIVNMMSEINTGKQPKENYTSSDLKTICTNQLFQKIIDTMSQRVYIKDYNFKYVGCNKLFARDAGVKNESEIIGKTDFDLIWKNYAQEYRNEDESVIKTG